jgi:signal transduction histidine kinase
VSPRSLAAGAGRWFAQLSIRWRLALTSAGLTFAILLVFAVVIGAFTANRLESDFDNDLEATAADLAQQVPVSQSVVEALATGDATMRIVVRGQTLAPPGATTDLGPPRPGVTEVAGYRVVSLDLPGGFLQYGRKQDSLDSTIARVELFLALGVLGGTALALLAGLAVARRAMRPIADLTRTAKGIARTRDPGARIPEPRADDEVADLARTLEEMLRGLDSARLETESTLAREREFVADASHELRTPLTSLLANLELLEAELRGEDREVAASALRSTQRMRRLVGDLLFLARADAGDSGSRAFVATDLSAVARDVVAETAPLSESHQVSLEAPSPVAVDGSRDDLHRLVLNLVQNAVAHTPPGTRVEVGVRQEPGDPSPRAGKRGPSRLGAAVLEVTDDGPGLPVELRERAFDRFVRGSGDGRGATGVDWRGSGLGLAIVAAVAESHGGRVDLEQAPGGGARFVVRMPPRGAARTGAEESSTAEGTAPDRLASSDLHHHGQH